MTRTMKTSASDTKPFCKDCAHYEGSGIGFLYDRCHRPPTRYNAVNGEAFSRFCDLERNSLPIGGSCGPSAIHFQPASPPPEAASDSVNTHIGTWERLRRWFLED